MTTYSETIKSLAEKLEAFLETPPSNVDRTDDAALHRLSEAARKVSFVTEARGDTVQRIAHSVNYLQKLQTTSGIMLDTELIESLVSPTSPCAYRN